jgi:hypothetical protein
MTFTKFIRIAEQPARADKSALGAIITSLPLPRRGCPERVRPPRIAELFFHLQNRVPTLLHYTIAQYTNAFDF